VALAAEAARVAQAVVLVLAQAVKARMVEPARVALTMAAAAVVALLLLAATAQLLLAATVVQEQHLQLLDRL
jgi:hypothetical protein